MTIPLLTISGIIQLLRVANSLCYGEIAEEVNHHLHYVPLTYYHFLKGTRFKKTIHMLNHNNHNVNVKC